ncbi:MAG: group II intron reverse transcriptase/maturase [Anaerolineae bacterium]|nr:group II intron reverse transcriptase/maturase [Anaerolineae bacterium]
MWIRRVVSAGHAQVCVEEALFSPEAMRRAWQVIRHNGTTPGVDRVSQREFERHLDRNLEALRQELISGTYEPLPVKRVLVPKAGGDWRPLAIWALRDRVAQRVVHEYLLAHLEPVFLDCSYGFRPGRSTRDAADAIVAAREAGRRWVVDADIEDCFGSLDSRRIVTQVRAQVPDRAVVDLIVKWLGANIANPAGKRSAHAAASQGGVITPLLANLYLHAFDLQMQRQVRHNTLVRFADDFIVLCQQQREAERALSVARHALRRLRLRLNPYKTRIVHFDEGFKFLGFFFLRDEVFPLNP